MDGGLRILFKQRMAHAHWQSIETWGIASGVPDAEYCFPEGIQGWIEFKGTGTNSVVIRPAQIAWAERRARVGGRIWLAIRLKCPKGPKRSAQDALFLYPGEDMREVLKNGLRIAPRGYWNGGVRNWDWDAIERMLTA